MVVYKIRFGLIIYSELYIIFQFDMVGPSEERPKLSVSFYGYSPPKITFSIPINQSVHYELVVMENMILGRQETENETKNFGHCSLGSISFLGPPGSM